MKIMASGLITSWQIDEEKVETVTDFVFLGSKIAEDGDCNDKIKKQLLVLIALSPLPWSYFHSF